MCESMQKNDVRMQWGVQIPLRDGVQLSASVYVPAGQKAAPAILVLTPYVSQAFHEYAMYFASYGYPFAAVDVRGRGNSEGTFHPNARAADSYDVCEWLARQPYCNGKVAMWGGSYSGYVQWVATKLPSRHLASIVPVASPYRGVDSPARNNIFIPYTVQWLTLIAGRTAQERIFADERGLWARQFRSWFESGTAYKDLDTFVGIPSALFKEWVSHPEVDEYWDSYNPSPDDYARTSIPVLTITGVYDGDQAGALMHYREHLKHASEAGRARHFLVIGPWDHAGTRAPKQDFGGINVGSAALLDLRKLHLEWYAWTMGDGSRPAFLRKNVAYYVMAADQWRYVDSLDAITAYTKPLYLDSTTNPDDVFRSGSLGTERPSGRKADSYRYDPADLSGAEYESNLESDSLVDQGMLLTSAGKQLIYHSAPCEGSVEISGFFKLSAWVAIDQPDTDFRASVYEIGVDGSSVLLARDSLRARYRESLRKATLVATREPLHYVFERFTFVSRRFAKGSRLRLAIGPINSIHSQRNYNNGGVIAEETISNARTVTVTLFHDELHPTVLHVPFGHPERDEV
jgi:putative CocE/NonD family hydrolase